MKKSFFLLILSFVVLLLSTYESDAQCASGYTSSTITLNIGGCTYDVLFCYKCAVSYPGEVYIRQIIKHPSIPPCVGWDSYDVLDYLYNYMNTGQFIYSIPCLYFGLKPCSLGVEEINIHFPFCWKETNIFYNNQPTVSQEPCDYDDYCQISIRACMDGDNLVVTRRIHSIFGVIPDCPEFDTVNIGECYIYHTECNP